MTQKWHESSAWPQNHSLVSVTRTALALLSFDYEIHPKVYGKYFSCSSVLLFLPVVNSIVEIEAAKSSSDANALQAPLNCDHTKFACLPSAHKPRLCSSKADLLNLQSLDPYSSAPLHGSLCKHRQWGQQQLRVSVWGQNALLSFNNNTSGNM